MICFSQTLGTIHGATLSSYCLLVTLIVRIIFQAEMNFPFFELVLCLAIVEASYLLYDFNKIGTLVIEQKSMINPLATPHICLTHLN